MYRREHRHQLSFEDFFLPFGGKLSGDNRWIKLANSGTLTSINGLAVDLRENGELGGSRNPLPGTGGSPPAAAGARRLPDRPRPGRPGQNPLEAAGKLEEALTYSQQALDHRLAHEGPEAWWSNCERLDLARVLHKLGRNSDASALLQELKTSINSNDDPDDDDRQLLRDADELMRAIEEP